VSYLPLYLSTTTTNYLLPTTYLLLPTCYYDQPTTPLSIFISSSHHYHSITIISLALAIISFSLIVCFFNLSSL
jgi:hypothetical protein